MSKVIYPVPVHPKFVGQLQQANTAMGIAQMQVQEAQKRLMLAQNHYDQMAEMVKTFQIELGQIDSDKVILQNFSEGWILPKEVPGANNEPASGS